MSRSALRRGLFQVERKGSEPDNRSARKGCGIDCRDGAFMGCFRSKAEEIISRPLKRVCDNSTVAVPRVRTLGTEIGRLPRNHLREFF